MGGGTNPPNNSFPVSRGSVSCRRHSQNLNVTKAKTCGAETNVRAMCPSHPVDELRPQLASRFSNRFLNSINHNNDGFNFIRPLPTHERGTWYNPLTRYSGIE